MSYRVKQKLYFATILTVVAGGRPLGTGSQAVQPPEPIAGSLIPFFNNHLLLFFPEHKRYGCTAAEFFVRHAVTAAKCA